MSPTLKSFNGFSDINPAVIAFSHSFFNCSTELTQSSSVPSSVLQIGIGIPQNLDLDKFQSLAFSSQFPNLPEPVLFGFQLISLLSETKRFFTLETFTNQESKG